MSFKNTDSKFRIIQESFKLKHWFILAAIFDTEITENEISYSVHIKN